MPSVPGDVPSPCPRAFAPGRPGDWCARFLGLFGEAPSLAAFTHPFSLLPLPSVASNDDADLLFARQRINI